MRDIETCQLWTFDFVFASSILLRQTCSTQRIWFAISLPRLFPVKERSPGNERESVALGSINSIHWINEWKKHYSQLVQLDVWFENETPENILEPWNEK